MKIGAAYRDADSCFDALMGRVSFLKGINSLNIKSPFQSMVIIHEFLLKTETAIQHAVAYSVTIPLVSHPTLVLALCTVTWLGTYKSSCVAPLVTATPLIRENRKST